MHIVERNENEPRKRAVFMIGVTALFILLSRLPAMLLTDRFTLYDPPDELEMTFSTADRFLGVPSVSLAWPGGTLQAIELPVLLSDFILHSHFPPSGKDFGLYISNFYRNPWHTLMLIRSMLIVLSSVGIACFYYVLFRFTSDRFLSLVGTIVMASLPIMWLHSHEATGDGLAIALACASIAAISWRESSSPFGAAVGGVLLGLAAASKITFVLLIPFAFSALFSLSKRKTRDITIFLICIPVAFLFACPYAWTDPIRLAKAILGNASRAGQPLGLGHSLLKMGAVSSIPVLLLSAAGMLSLIRRQQWALLFGTLFTLLAMLAITAKSAVVFDRYYLPSILPLILLTCAGLNELKMRFERSRFQRLHAVYVTSVIVIASSVCLPGAVSYAALVRENSTKAQQTEELLDRIASLKPAGPVAIPPSLLYYLGDRASSRSLDALAKKVPPLSADGILGDFGVKRGIPKDILRLFGRAFTELEQVLAARLQVMAYPDDRSGWEMIVWDDNAERAKRFGFVQEKEIDSLLSNRELPILVVDTNSDVFQQFSSEVYGPYRLLINSR